MPLHLALLLCKMLTFIPCPVIANADVHRSWVTYFFYEKFGLKEEKLGSLFFTTNVIAAISMLLASSIAKRFGNIKVRTLPFS